MGLNARHLSIRLKWQTIVNNRRNGMEQMKKLILALAMFGCAGNLDTDDIGSLEQPLVATAQCGGAMAQYGVNLCFGGGSWTEPRCDRNTSTNCCFFPTSLGGYAVQLQNGWTSVNRVVVKPFGESAAASMEAQFTAWSLFDPDPRIHFNSTQSDPAPFVAINKVSLNAPPAVLNAGSASVGMDTFVHMACIHSAVLGESPSMNASFSKCGQWSVDFDFDRFAAWMSLTPVKAINGELDHMLRSIFLRAMGLGQVTGTAFYGNTTVMESTVLRSNTVRQSYLSGETAWPNNFNINSSDPVPTIQCVP